MRACGDAARPWPSPDRAPARDDTPHTHTVHHWSDFELAWWCVQHPEARFISPASCRVQKEEGRRSQVQQWQRHTRGAD